MDCNTSGVRHLTPQQSAPAFEVLTTAFDAAECQFLLWNATKAFLGSEHADGLTAKERSNHIFFYETISAVIEAVFLLQRSSPAQVVLFSPPPAA